MGNLASLGLAETVSWCFLSLLGCFCTIFQVFEMCDPIDLIFPHPQYVGSRKNPMKRFYVLLGRIWTSTCRHVDSEL